MSEKSVEQDPQLLRLYCKWYWIRLFVTPVCRRSHYALHGIVGRALAGLLAVAGLLAFGGLAGLRTRCFGFAG